MSVFTKRRTLVVVASLVIVLGASVAIWGLPKFLKRSTSVKSQVTAYLLDDRGGVTGLLLASGDQLHFSQETGAIVAAQIKVGDEVTATGHAGEQTSYGREVRVEQIAANGKTILEVRGGRGPKPDRHHGPKGRGDRGDREEDGRSNVAPPVKTTDEKPLSETQAATAPGPDAKASPTASPESAGAPELTAETTKVSGTIRAHLVNGRGDVDGLILSGGEQLLFSPKVGKLVIAAEQGSTTQVSVEGTAVRNEHGVIFRPRYITLGNQTISVGR